MRFELTGSEVHVWRATLEVPGDLRRACADWLSSDERARASGHRIERLRHRYIVRVGLRRALLARYLGARPEDLRFAYGSKDKPRLAGDRSRQDLQFNCSHSSELALIAVTRGREIGVDVERVRDDVRCTELATRYFAPAEAMALARETPDKQRDLFFRYWTGKEAWIKAEGGGLSIPLRQFEVRFSAGEGPARVVTLADVSGDLLGYVYPLRVAGGYAAALAAAEPGLEVQLRQWTPEMALKRAV